MYKVSKVDKQKANSESSRITILICMLICSIIGSYAASPIEMEIEGIVYRLNSTDTTASVVGLNAGMTDVNILENIEYQDVSYQVTKISNEAFTNQSAIVTIKIPDSILEIGYKAFWRCENLKSVIWGNAIETIGNSAFGHCNSLKEAILPNSVKVVGTMAFISCKNLETVNIPTSLKEIWQSAFDECKNLKAVHIDDIVSYCSAIIYHADIFFANAPLYTHGKLITELIIPQEVESITSSAFCECGSLEKVTLPNTLKLMGSSCFELCPNLKEVNIYSNLEIGSWCFGSCSQLSTINIYSDIPPSVQTDPFYKTYPEYMILHVPEGTKETYEKADVWKDFGTIIGDLPNESGVENILIDNTQPMEIYNLEGECVFSGIGNYELKSGFYIIRQGPKCKKIIIE